MDLNILFYFLIIIEPDETYELATGDFWLDFRPDFYGGFVYVPFKNGKLITDKTEWVIKNSSYKNTDVTHYKNSNTENLLSKIKKIFKY